MFLKDNLIRYTVFHSNNNIKFFCSTYFSTTLFPENVFFSSKFKSYQQVGTSSKNTIKKMLQINKGTAMCHNNMRQCEQNNISFMNWLEKNVAAKNTSYSIMHKNHRNNIDLLCSRKISHENHIVNIIIRIWKWISTAVEMVENVSRNRYICQPFRYCICMYFVKEMIQKMWIAIPPKASPGTPHWEPAKYLSYP